MKNRRQDAVQESFQVLPVVGASVKHAEVSWGGGVDRGEKHTPLHSPERHLSSRETDESKIEDFRKRSLSEILTYPPLHTTDLGVFIQNIKLSCG